MDDNDKPKLKLNVTDCPVCGASVLPSELIPAGDQTVCPNCRDSYVQSLKEGVPSSALDTSSRGTGGATPNRELRAMARAALSGNWGGAAGVVFLYLLISIAMSLIPIVGTIAQWFIAGPLFLGFNLYFLGLVRSEPVTAGNLFDGFSSFWKGVGIYLVTSIIVGLAAMAAAIPGALLVGGAFAMDPQAEGGNPLLAVGFLAAFVPAFFVGIYMYLRYALVYFLVKDDPEIGVFETLKVSVRRMDGHKKKLFGLLLSYFPWFILSMLTLFITVPWVWAYMMTGFAAFYDDLGEEA